MAEVIPVSYSIFILCYMAGMIVVGWLLSRKAKSLAAYTTAYRGLAWYVTAATVFATITGAAVMIQGTYLGYTVGILGSVQFLFVYGGLLLFILFIYPRIAVVENRHTLPEVIGDRFGKSARLLYGVLLFIREAAQSAGQYAGAATILMLLLPVKLNTAILIIAAVIAVYVTLAGLYSVAWMDFIQTNVIVVGFLVLLVGSYIKTGGLSGLSANVPPQLLSLSNYEATFRAFGYGKWSSNALMSTIMLAAAFLPGMIVRNEMYQRVWASQTPHAAKKGLWTAFVVGIIGSGVVPIWLGMSARAMWPTIDPKQAYAYAAVNLLPGFLPALFLACVLAAISSSIDSYIMSGSSVAVHNIWALLVPTSSEKTKLTVARVASVVLVAVSALLAMYFKWIIPALMFSWTLLASGGLPVVLSAFLWPRVTDAAAISSIGFGGLIALVWEFILKRPGQIPTVVPGLLASTLALIVVTMLTQQSDAEKERWVAFSKTYKYREDV